MSWCWSVAVEDNEAGKMVGEECKAARRTLGVGASVGVRRGGRCSCMLLCLELEESGDHCHFLLLCKEGTSSSVAAGESVWYDGNRIACAGLALLRATNSNTNVIIASGT